MRLWVRCLVAYDRRGVVACSLPHTIARYMRVLSGFLTPTTSLVQRLGHFYCIPVQECASGRSPAHPLTNHHHHQPSTRRRCIFDKWFKRCYQIVNVFRLLIFVTPPILCCKRINNVVSVGHNMLHFFFVLLHLPHHCQGFGVLKFAYSHFQRALVGSSRLWYMNYITVIIIMMGQKKKKLWWEKEQEGVWCPMPFRSVGRLVVCIQLDILGVDIDDDIITMILTNMKGQAMCMTSQYKIDAVILFIYWSDVNMLS